MTLSRLLAWEVVAVHLLTGALFAGALAILLAVSDVDGLWVWVPFSPLIAFAWLGWAYEGWVIWRGTADLRKGEMRDGK